MPLQTGLKPHVPGYLAMSGHFLDTPLDRPGVAEVELTDLGGAVPAVEAAARFGVQVGAFREKANADRLEAVLAVRSRKEQDVPQAFVLRLDP